MKSCNLPETECYVKLRGVGKKEKDIHHVVLLIKSIIKNKKSGLLVTLAFPHPPAMVLRNKGKVASEILFLFYFYF